MDQAEGPTARTGRMRGAGPVRPCSDPGAAARVAGRTGYYSQRRGAGPGRRPARDGPVLAVAAWPLWSLAGHGRDVTQAEVFHRPRCDRRLLAPPNGGSMEK